MTGLLVGTLVVALAGGAVAMDRMALTMIRPRQKPVRRKVARLPFEARAHAFSSTGQSLSGWILKPEVDRGGPVVVMAHGWGSTHGKMVPVAEPLLRAGHPVFLFDIRHHGDSPPAPFVTVRHFRDDITAAAGEMKELFPDRPIVLVGHSMGGSAGVLAATSGAPLHGLVTIGSPADLWQVWAHHLDEKRLPGAFIVRLLQPFWRRRVGVPFRTLRPEEKARELGIPLLVIHGELDESVTVSHARVLAEANGTAAFIMEEEDHNRLLENPELHGRLLTFLQSVSG